MKKKTEGEMAIIFVDSHHEPIFHLLSYLKMSHHPNVCSSLVHNYERVSKGGHVILNVKLFISRKYPSTLDVLWNF